LKNDQEFFERRIITGMIVSKEYLDRIHRFWDSTLLESQELKMIADWCMDYYKKYNRAPDENIESIYLSTLKDGFLSKSEAQYIEQLLADLSDEYGRDTQFNAAYLYDRTMTYLKSRELERFNEEVQALVDQGKVEEAQKLQLSYTPKIMEDTDLGLDLSSKEALNRVERAFTETNQRVLTYPGALGDMWNEHLIRGGFFTLLGPEKRGKTFLLLELSLRAIRQKANVAFFAAGDMTESQMLRRICVYICQRSDREKYCQERFVPVGDCVFNQLNLCERPDRNCDHGVFDAELESFFRSQDEFLNIENIREKFEENPDYEPCDSHSCPKRRGSVWIKKVPASSPLSAPEAKKALRKFFRKYRRRFKLATYPAGILTVSEIRRILNDWEKYDGFVPDLIAIDYADLLSADDGKANEFRHRQDHIWKSLRALSQERHVLLVTATQADADSYKRGRLSLSNFSEDKRKLAHVTAQYGLNQDPQGREKKIGIMRINEIVVREGEFSPENEVFILQDLSAGRPFLESFTQSIRETK
jgi:hypothetical protein